MYARVRNVLMLFGLTIGLGHASQLPAVHGAQGDLATVLVSRQLLAARHLEVGDVVELSGDPSGANPRRFRIAGAYEPMPDPIRVASERLEVRLHLPDLLSLTSDPTDAQAGDSLSAINVKLHRPEDAEAFARDLAARVPTVGVRSSRGGDTDGNPFVVLSRFHLAIASLTVITGAVFLLALMVLLADERRETVGTLRLIGLTRARVLAQVLLEGAVIAGAGAVFGVALAALTENAFNAFFQWRYDTSLVFVRITPSIAWQSIAVAMPLGMAASVLASWALVRSNTLKLVRR
jgi:predicted lysophospholipase L1 biosynthesis ABC-type transport system permease subunit